MTSQQMLYCRTSRYVHKPRCNKNNKTTLTNKIANSPTYLSSRRVSLYTAQLAYSRLDPNYVSQGPSAWKKKKRLHCRQPVKWITIFLAAQRPVQATQDRSHQQCKPAASKLVRKHQVCGKAEGSSATDIRVKDPWNKGVPRVMKR